MTQIPENSHWLVRPATLRWLTVISLLILAMTIAAQWWFPYHGYFGFDDWPAFAAVYGFLACVAMVITAQLLGRLLKRPEDYYRAHDDD